MFTIIDPCLQQVISPTHNRERNHCELYFIAPIKHDTYTSIIFCQNGILYIERNNFLILSSKFLKKKKSSVAFELISSNIEWAIKLKIIIFYWTRLFQTNWDTFLVHFWLFFRRKDLIRLFSLCLMLSKDNVI